MASCQIIKLFIRYFIDCKFWLSLLWTAGTAAAKYRYVKIVTGQTLDMSLTVCTYSSNQPLILGYYHCTLINILATTLLNYRFRAECHNFTAWIPKLEISNNYMMINIVSFFCCNLLYTTFATYVTVTISTQMIIFTTIFRVTLSSSLICNVDIWQFVCFVFWG